MTWREKLEKIDPWRVRIPEGYKAGMRVPGIIYVSAELLEQMAVDQAPEQVANVACLPGIISASLAMPDIHWGYGFPIGGVAAFDTETGIISPGGVGYDINCGVRLLATQLKTGEILPKMAKLLQRLKNRIPAGVGSEGRVRLLEGELDEVIVSGARWAVEKGYGHPRDLERIESRGEMQGSDPAGVSGKARRRGAPQLGSLGAGNHFLEVQTVEEIYDLKVAKAFGLTQVGQVTVLIHTGSRGFGHQICTDSIEIMQRCAKEYGIVLPDRQLACAPIRSREGQRYLGAMRAAANFACANRQMITHWIREVFLEIFGAKERELPVEVVYDLAHNVAKIEDHLVGGLHRQVCVHRKGATRAFPAGHPDLPACYRAAGQPVLIPGDMGRGSFVLVGEARTMGETFGSTCHGAGRIKSRSEAKRGISGSELLARLAGQGITVLAESQQTLVEEAPEAYKDVTEVVAATVGAGLARKVARMKPLGVIKG